MPRLFYLAFAFSQFSIRMNGEKSAPIDPAKNGGKNEQKEKAKRDSREQIIDTISSRYRRRCPRSHRVSACGAWLSLWAIANVTRDILFAYHREMRISHAVGKSFFSNRREKRHIKSIQDQLMAKCSGLEKEERTIMVDPCRSLIVLIISAKKIISTRHFSCKNMRDHVNESKENDKLMKEIGSREEKEEHHKLIGSKCPVVK